MEFLLYPFSVDFLLPGNVTYADFRDTPQVKYVKKRHLAYMPLYGLALLLLRKLYEATVAKQLAKWAGVRDARKECGKNPLLEAAYKITRNPDDRQLDGYAKRLDMSVARIRRWFRRRRNRDRPSLVQKFGETSWRFLFYLISFSYGIATLWQTPWFWSPSKCWDGFPVQGMWDSTFYYYMLEGGFYMSLLFSLGTDNRRKDFWEQVVHHLATITLITFSYACNFIRVGSLVMAIHDVSDILLEFAKCALYAQKRQLADNLFTVFAVVFLLSRLVVFPRVVLYVTLVESLRVCTPYSGYYFFNFFLMVLQLLHVFWACTIVKMAWQVMRKGRVEKDDRSDEDEVSTDED